VTGRPAPVYAGWQLEHTSTEIWSNQYRKWIMLDPTANLYVEKDGVPLDAYEIRTEWFYREGKDLVFSIGKERKKYRKADLPIFLGRFAGFGDLTVPANEMEKYGFTAYIPNSLSARSRRRSSSDGKLPSCTATKSPVLAMFAGSAR